MEATSNGAVSAISHEDAKEATEALDQVIGGSAEALSGSYRLLALEVRRGTPKALGVTNEEWCQARGAKARRWAIPERREAVAELSADGLSTREIGDVLGVDHKTVSNDRRAGGWQEPALAEAWPPQAGRSHRDAEGEVLGGRPRRPAQGSLTLPPQGQPLARAPKICSQPHCANTQPCPDHTPKPWASSQRSTRTISGSRQQKRAARIMRAHDRTCHVCSKPMADEVDHVVPLAEGGADDDSNLRPIHSRPCHMAKTQAEAQRARSTA